MSQGQQASEAPFVSWSSVLVPGSLSPLLANVPKQFPRWMRVRQHLAADALADPGSEAWAVTAAGLANSRRPIRPGMRIAITAGSRGIASITDVLRGCIAAVKEAGADPFIVAAMGSHGGATPEGQRGILHSYGISEETMGVPIDARMDVAELGRIDGVPIYFSTAALEADGIIVIGRVKPHTSFRGPVESGLCKMMAVGLGKHKGAAALHGHGIQRMGEILPKAAALIMKKAPILGAIPLLENARQQLAHLEWVEPEAILEREPELLKQAWQLMPRLLAHDLHVLIVDEMGKNISGTGMDPNITGRAFYPGMTPQPWVERLVVRSLTPESHGNFNGIVQADIIPRRVVEAMDFYSTYTNGITTRSVASARIPFIVDSDRDAVAFALYTSSPCPVEQKRLVRIRHTGALEEIYISEGLWHDEKDKGLFTPLSELQPMAFSADGDLLDI